MGLETQSNSESYSYCNVLRTQPCPGRIFYPIQLTSGAYKDSKCRTTNPHADYRLRKFIQDKTL